MNLSLAVPKEFPVTSTARMPLNFADKLFGKHDLEVAKWMPSTCKTKHFDVWYEAKISVKFDKLIGKNKDTERFPISFV